MSFLTKYLAGWSFRTSHPTFDPDDEFTVVVTDMKDGMAVARIGDSMLHIQNAPASTVDNRVRVRVIEFDDEKHVGDAEFLKVVGEATF